MLLTSLSHTLCVLSFPDRNGGLSRGSHRSLLQVPNTYSDVPVDWQLWCSWRWRWRVWTQQGFFLSCIHLVFLILHNSSKTGYSNTTGMVSSKCSSSWSSGLNLPESMLLLSLLGRSQRIPVTGAPPSLWISGCEIKASRDSKVSQCKLCFDLYKVQQVIWFRF